MDKQLKVIKIFDKYSVLINAGSNDRIKNSTKFEVYTLGEEVIVDDVNYGTLDNIKATLEVKTLYPEMCLCQSDRIIKTIKPSIYNLHSQFKDQTIEEIAPLDIDDSIFGEDSSNDKFSYMEDKVIKIGDLVRIKK